MTGPTLGAWVRCQRDTPTRGSWKRWAGRVGRVVVVNRVTPNGYQPARYEYGIRFTGGEAAQAWFLAAELVTIDRPANAPTIPLRDERDAHTSNLAPADAATLPGVGP